jgi:GT2 family glycosyltransferase
VNPLVSIVILNYNGRSTLGEYLLFNCLSSVLRSNYDNFEVIFVDNGSTDGSVQFILEKIGCNANLKILSHQKNYGFAQGNNLAMKHVRGDYVILLNNDVEVEPNWIRELVKALETDPIIGCAQSKVLSFDRIHIQSVGNLLDSTLSTYNIGKNQEDKGQFDRACEITYPLGAAFITRRELIKKIGLFDPNYFFYHDDCDLGWRIWLAGFKVISVPSSIVYHKGRSTSDHIFKIGHIWFFFFTSQFGLFIKNLGSKNFLKIGSIMLTNMAMNFLNLLLQGDATTSMKSIWWTLKNFKCNWKNRLIIQKKIRKVSDSEVFKNFLDSSVFVLRIKKIFDRFSEGKLYRNFDSYVSQVTYDYYKKHIYTKSRE